MLNSYVVVADDPANKVVVDGPLMWDGFEPGHGTWVVVGDGSEWSCLGESGLTYSGQRFKPTAGDRMMVTADAMAAGYSWPVPPAQDSDGDGVPDDRDAAPDDPTIQ